MLKPRGNLASRVPHPPASLRPCMPRLHSPIRRAKQHLVEVGGRVAERASGKARVEAAGDLPRGELPGDKQPSRVDRHHARAHREQVPHGCRVLALERCHQLRTLVYDHGGPAGDEGVVIVRAERGDACRQRRPHEDLPQLGAVVNLERAAERRCHERLASVLHDRDRQPGRDEADGAVRDEQLATLGGRRDGHRRLRSTATPHERSRVPSRVRAPSRRGSGFLST